MRADVIEIADVSRQEPKQMSAFADIRVLDLPYGKKIGTADKSVS